MSSDSTTDGLRRRLLLATSTSTAIEGLSGPESVPVLCEKGKKLRRERQLNQAANCFLRALQIDPGSAVAALQLGELYFRDMNQADRAIRYYDIAERLDPDSDEPIRGHAEALVAMAKVVEARAVVEGWLARPGVTARGWLRKGVVFQTREQYDRAEQCFRTAALKVKEDPSQHEYSCEAMFHLAELLNWLDRDKESAEWFGAYLKLRPKDPVAVRGYAAVLNAIGRNDEAVRLLEHYRLLRPQDTWPLLSIARIRGLEQGRQDEGLQYLTLYERSENDASCLAYALQVRGEIEESRQAYREAVDAYERSIKYNDHDPRTYYSLARVWEISGDRARAKKYAQRARELGPGETTYITALDRLEDAVGLPHKKRPSVKHTLSKISGV